MLAADAEARRVIAIENSAFAKIAQQIVADNQLDNVVTIIRGKVEEVELPEEIKEVDIIIAEWVGHGLFPKNKLASLIFARDKWLAADGLVFPDRCRLFIGGAEGALWREERYGFWNQVFFVDGAINRAQRVGFFNIGSGIGQNTGYIAGRVRVG